MPDRFYLGVGELIRKARTRAGMTQEQLADRVKLTRTSVTNIEKGRQRLLVHTLIDIAAALEVKPERLLPMHGEDEEVLAFLDPEARRWIQETVATADAEGEPR